MTDEELEQICDEIEASCGTDDVWAIPIPYGLTAGERAADLTGVDRVCARLRERGRIPKVTTRRPGNGEFYFVEVQPVVDDMEGL